MALKDFSPFLFICYASSDQVTSCFILSCFLYSSNRISTVVIDESPRPTRFDWPEVNLDAPSYTSSFDDLSYETKPLLKPSMCADSRPPVPKVDTTQKVATFEEVCRTATNMKRMPSSGTVQDEIAAKKAKILDLQVTDEV
jgi:hypothetical protein